MNLFLTGFMGTGKTTVGRRVAEKLGVPFVDMDLAIEHKAGMSIAAIFSSVGEAGFRQMESDFIAQLASGDRAVIATGGGVIVSAANREQIARHGLLVCLTAQKKTLLERLQGKVLRPLLNGDNLSERLEQLLSERESIYSACSIQVATDQKSVDQVADEIVNRVADQWEL